MTDPFIIKALIAGIGVALMCGPLGCFVAWQRMAYFGDTIAHAALLGVVLAIAADAEANLGILAVALAIAVAVFRLERENRLASDTLLGLFSHGALALGLVIISLSPSITLDVNGLLFGDILAVGTQDIALIYAVAAVTVIALTLNWKNLMRLTLHPDIARVEGVNAARLRLVMMLGIAAAVAVSIKITGILLITSMLIIPAASVRYICSNPTQMAIAAALAGMLSVCGGLYASLLFDTPSGPSIILAGFAIFSVTYVVAALRARAE